MSSATLIPVLMVAVAGAACTRTPAQVSQRPRVVSLHDVTTEVVVALGAVDLLVAVAEPIEQPPSVSGAIARLPRVGDAESIIAAAPTLLLGMAVVGQRSPDLVDRLRARGTDVLLGDPQTLDEVFTFVSLIADRLGRTAQATNLIEVLRRQSAAALPDPAPSQKPSKVEVFVYDCCDPPFTAGGRGVLSDLIWRAGGRNVFSKVEAAWAAVAWEAAIAGRPGLIVINDYAMAGQDDVAGKRARLATMPAFARVPTVVLPLGEALGGIRSVDGLKRLARAVAAVRGVEPRL
jgi:iron complex transport system substrate-binding protein